MLLRLSLLVVSSLLLATAAVQAAPPASIRLQRGYIMGEKAPHRIPSDPAAAAAAAAIYPNHTVFFNRHGGTYNETWPPNSSTNANGIGSGTIPAFACGDDAWVRVMTCLKKGFGRYDITVTDVDPGDAPHTETVIGGLPQHIGLGQGIAGIANMGCGQQIARGVSFAFSEVYGCQPGAMIDICWAAAQETAHLFGLDHEIHCQDFLTYDYDCGTAKAFADVDSRCGEDDDYPPNNPGGLSGARDCTCDGASTQNSHRMMTAIFGGKGNTGPEIDSLDPADGGVVQAGFKITAVVYDDEQVEQVDAFVDGERIGQLAVQPFRFTPPAGLANGEHTLRIVATDSDGVVSERTSSFSLVPPCEDNAGCPDTHVCDQRTGFCMAGPGEPGGIGALCGNSEECDSGICAGGPGGEMRCVTLCTTGDPTTCPAEFDCLQAGGNGACWPSSGAVDPGGDDEGGGGCGCAVGGRGQGQGQGQGQGTSGGDAAAFGLGGLGVALLVARRRRRQAEAEAEAEAETARGRE